MREHIEVLNKIKSEYVAECSDCGDCGDCDDKRICFDFSAIQALCMAIEALQERPQGKWIKTSNDWIDGHCGQRFFPYHCGCCGHKTWDDELTNYCPNCGARMESSEK